MKIKSKTTKSSRLSLYAPYAGLAVNLVRLGSLQPRASAWAPLQLLSVQPHRGISCFFAHILRALALRLCWVLPEKRERWWRMPGALPHPPPVLPGQIKQRVCEGRRRSRRRSTGTMCPSHLSLPSPSAVQTYNGIEQYSCLIQTYKIKQLSRVISRCWCLTPHSLPPTDPPDLVQVWVCVSLTERGHIHNPNNLSWLHYDPETLKWDRLDAGLSVMESTKAGCISRCAHSLIINRPMDFFGALMEGRKGIRRRMEM